MLLATKYQNQHLDQLRPKQNTDFVIFAWNELDIPIYYEHGEAIDSCNIFNVLKYSLLIFSYGSEMPIFI